LVLLQDQDRSRWNQGKIDEGRSLPDQAIALAHRKDTEIPIRAEIGIFDPFTVLQFCRIVERLSHARTGGFADRRTGGAALPPRARRD